MCGICGIHRFSEAPIQRDMVDLLLLNNMNRGLEATGVALQQADGEVLVLKRDSTPFEFVSGYEYKAFMDKNLKPDTITALGHTRKVTKGSPRKMENNHPMFAGNTALVHNGQIHNDDWAFKEMKLERRAETDSDIFRAILDKEGFTRKAIGMMTRLDGNGAFAAISQEHPGKLLLGRSGNPIEMVATPDFLMFSSEKGPMYKALRPFKQVYGVMMREMTPINYYMIGMTDHSAWLFAEKPKAGDHNWAADWLEWHQEMRIATHYTPVNYTCHAQFHGNRIKFYDDRPIDVVQCPGCKVYLHVTKALLKDLKKYVCGSCKTSLG